MVSFPIHAKSAANIWALRLEAFEHNFGPYTCEGLCFAEFTLLIFQLFISVGFNTVVYEVKVAFDDDTYKLSNIVLDRVDQAVDYMDDVPNSRRSNAVEDTENQLMEEMMRDVGFAQRKDTMTKQWSLVPPDPELEDLAGFSEWYITKQTPNGEIKQFAAKKTEEYQYSVKTMITALQEQGK